MKINGQIFKNEIGYSYEDLKAAPELVKGFTDKQLLFLKRANETICCFGSSPCENHKDWDSTGGNVKDFQNYPLIVMWEEINKRKLRY